MYGDMLEISAEVPVHLHKKCPSWPSDFNQTWPVSTNLSTSLQYKVLRKSVQRKKKNNIFKFLLKRGYKIKHQVEFIAILFRSRKFS
jgi:hypothetical protein